MSDGGADVVEHGRGRGEVATTPGWQLAALFVVALLPLFSTPLLPFIDFYNHLARYHVLAHLADSAFLQQFYASRWALLPNIGLDVIGTALLKVVPAWAAGHVIAVLILATQYAGVLYFHRALTGRVSLLVAVLMVPLLYSYILNWGFSNFLFGLGLAFAAAGWWLRHRGWRGVLLASLFALAIFFTHAFAFALYGLLLGSLELGYLWMARERRPLAWARALAPVAVQAVLPALLFVLTATAKSTEGLTNADEAITRLRAKGALLQRVLDLAWYRLETIVRVAEGPSFAADALWFAAVAALVGLLLWRGRLAVVRLAWPALAVGLLLTVVIPPTLFAVGFVADRVPLYVALLFVAGLEPRRAARGIERGVEAALAVLVALRLLSIAWSWQGYARTYPEFEVVAAAIPPGSLVNQLMVGGAEQAARVPRCGMYAPLLITNYGQVVSLFADPAKQPLAEVGALAAGVAAMPADRGVLTGIDADFYDGFLRSLHDARRFDYVLICNADRLPRALPAFAPIVARTAHFAVVRLR